jgi:hypothetical protein
MVSMSSLPEGQGKRYSPRLSDLQYDQGPMWNLSVSNIGFRSPASYNGHGRMRVASNGPISDTTKLAPGRHLRSERNNSSSTFFHLRCIISTKGDCGITPWHSFY